VFDRQVQEIQIGEPNVLPVFSENLRGLKPEETREFATEMENNPQLPTSIRGKRVFCKVELLALRARELPELDDAFAQGLPGEFAGLDELRQKMREQFEKNADRKATEQAQEALLDQLVEQTGIEVPEFLIQKRVQERARRSIRRCVIITRRSRCVSNWNIRKRSSAPSNSVWASVASRAWRCARLFAAVAWLPSRRRSLICAGTSISFAIGASFRPPACWTSSPRAGR